MDPITMFINLLTQTSFGLPLFVLVAATLIWALAVPIINPPVMTPWAVRREMPPDTISTIYWAIASGLYSSALGFTYQRFVAAVRIRYNVSPWEIPWRRSKAKKLGIEHPKELAALEKDLLWLYNEALILDNSAASSFFGQSYWTGRKEKYRVKLNATLGSLQSELPELWGG
jgi:hypothetical protein